MSDAVKAALREAGEAARLSLGADGGCLQIACANCTLPPCACADAAAAAVVAAFLRALPPEFHALVRFDSGNVDPVFFAEDWELLAAALTSAAQEDKR